MRVKWGAWEVEASRVIRVLRRVSLVTLLVAGLSGLPVATLPASQPRPVAPVVHEVALATPTAANIPRPRSGQRKETQQDPRGVGARKAQEAGERPSRPSRVLAAAGTGRFSLLGVTWPPGATEPTSVSVRVRADDGAWTAWEDLEAHSEDGPDRDSADGRSQRPGTAPLFTGPATAWELRATDAPHGMRVALVDPGRSGADVVPSAPNASADAYAGRPGIYSRAQWGADESIRRRGPTYSRALKVAFVHHTVSSNSYTSAQSAGLIRSIYAYHVKSRGWADIGYNLLVDRFGRVFEGRYGGVDRAVLGSHTEGFNTSTVGVAMLGTHSSVAPSSQSISALQRLLAWRLGIAHVDPAGRATLTSAGNDRFRSGTRVTFNTIAGHRDAKATDCPGGQLYARLAPSRGVARAVEGVALYDPVISDTTPLFRTDTSVTISARASGALIWRLTVTDAASRTVLDRTGEASGAFSTRWDLVDPATGTDLLPGFYRVVLTGRNAQGNAARPYEERVSVEGALPPGLAVRAPDGALQVVTETGLADATPALLRALRDPATVVAAYPAQLALPHTRLVAPNGLAGRGADGVIRLVVGGELLALSADAAQTLGYDRVPLPVLEREDFGLASAPSDLFAVDAHGDGALVTDGIGTWLLEAGLRRPLAASLVATYVARVPLAATAADLERAEGAAAPPGDGAWLTTDDGTRWFVSRGVRRSVSAPVARRLGLDPAAARAVPTPDLTGATKLGPLVA